MDLAFRTGLVLSLLLCWHGASAATAAEDPVPRITPNDNQTAAGELRRGVLTIRLVATTGAWFPEDASGPSVLMQAFGVEGQMPTVPAPLIRVPEGTEVVAIVRNDIPNAALRVHGLHARPAATDTPLLVRPGEQREIRFKSGAAGTYHYWATTTDSPLDRRFGIDSQLSGAFIVDQRDERAPQPRDRVLVIGQWEETLEAAAPKDALPRSVVSVNGRSWPHTERLTYRVGDAVRWRVINLTDRAHPMHLHGFYYRVDSIGDGRQDTLYSIEQQRRVVTELMPSGGTMMLTWVPERAGNWLFHCHILFHIASEFTLLPKPFPPTGHGHNHHEGPGAGMAGLVMGLHVLPNETTATAPTVSTAARRPLTLVMHTMERRFGDDPGYGFALQKGDEPPTPGDVTIPGPALVLTRGEPVEITLVNRLPDYTSIHWHGIELESYFDGVAGWGGSSRSITPAIAPGGSFDVRFTPPRAGTFIYHTHSHDYRQIASGLFGALIVLEPNQTWDPVTDHVFVMALNGPAEEEPLAVNGTATPQPLVLKKGLTHRLRFIDIAAAHSMVVTLLNERELIPWRARAKDGADLPPVQSTMRPAQQVVGAGETYDFEITPVEPAKLWLNVMTTGGRWVAQQKVIVQ